VFIFEIKKRAVLGLPLRKSYTSMLIVHPCNNTKRGVVAESFL